MTPPLLPDVCRGVALRLPPVVLGKLDQSPKLLRNLLRWSAGQRTWSSAVAELITYGELYQAQRELIEASGSADFDDLTRYFLTQLAETHDRFVHARENLMREVELLADLSPDFADHARKELQCAGAILNRWKLARHSIESSAIQAADNTILRKALDEAEAALSLLREQAQVRENQRKEEVRRFRSALDALIESLDETANASQIDSLANEVRRATKTQNLAHLSTLLQYAQALQAGSNPTLIAPPPSTPVPSPEVSRPRRLTAPRDWTTLSQIRLEAPLTPAQGPLLNPSELTWEIGVLRNTVRALRDEATSDLRYAVHWASRWGQLDLLEGDELHSRASFLDALRHALDAQATALSLSTDLPPNEFVERSLLGLCISIALPQIPRQDRQKVLSPVNLTALWNHGLDFRILSHLHQRRQMADLGRSLGYLGAERLDRVFPLLQPFLVRHPAAAEEFSRGLGRAEDGLRLGARIVGSLLRATDSAIQGPAPDATETQLFRWLRRLGVEHGLPSALAEECETLANLVQDNKPFTWEVLTTRIPLQKELEVIFSFKAPDNLRDIPDLVRVEIEGAQAPLRLVFTCPPPGQRVEFPLSLKVATDLPSMDLNARAMTAKSTGVWAPILLRPRASTLHLEAHPPRPRPANPYLMGDTLKNPAQTCWGRSKVIEQIYNSLCGEHQDNVVLVMGDRRVGKTSVLYALLNEPRVIERWKFRILVDQQDLPAAGRHGRFLDRIYQACQTKVRAPLEPGISGSPGLEDPGEWFKRAMKSLDDFLGQSKTRILLAIDELEKMFELVEAQRNGESGLPDEAVASLRAVVQASRNISFVFAGVTDVLRRHTGTRRDRLFRLAIEIPLDNLDKDSTVGLAVEPARATYDASKVSDRIWAETHGQPYLTQSLCHALFEQMVEVGRSTATLTDVGIALERRILDRHNLFVDFITPWKREEGGEDTLRAIARLQGYGRSFTLTDLSGELRRQDKDTDSAKVRDLLERMVEACPSVFKRLDAQAGRYQIRIGLVASYLNRRDDLRSTLILRS
jgi:hypothetical protein